MSCCCSMAGTRACDTCPNGPSYNPQLVPYQLQMPVKKFELNVAEHAAVQTLLDLGYTITKGGKNVGK